LARIDQSAAARGSSKTTRPEPPRRSVPDTRCPKTPGSEASPRPKRASVYSGQPANKPEGSPRPTLTGRNQIALRVQYSRGANSASSRQRPTRRPIALAKGSSRALGKPNSLNSPKDTKLTLTRGTSHLSTQRCARGHHTRRKPKTKSTSVANPERLAPVLSTHPNTRRLPNMRKTQRTGRAKKTSSSGVATLTVSH